MSTRQAVGFGVTAYLVVAILVGMEGRLGRPPRWSLPRTLFYAVLWPVIFVLQCIGTLLISLG